MDFLDFPADCVIMNRYPDLEVRYSKAHCCPQQNTHKRLILLLHLLPMQTSHDQSQGKGWQWGEHFFPGGLKKKCL